MVTTDAALLGEILTEVVDNSIHFSKTGGTITVQVDAANKEDAEDLGYEEAKDEFASPSNEPEIFTDVTAEEMPADA